MNDKFSGVELLNHPPIVLTADEGSAVEATCTFGAPKGSATKVEWVKVNYEGVNGTQFFTKDIQVLKSEDEWYMDSVAHMKDVDIKITRKDQDDKSSLITTTLTVSKMSSALEGVYTCHLVEQTATPYTYVSAFTELLLAGRESMLETKNIALKLFLCQDMYEVMPLPFYHIKEGVPNCFSCGGYGYPRPRMVLYKV